MRKRKKRIRRDKLRLLRAVVGSHNLAAANEQIKRYRLESAAAALDKILADKKRREIARLRLKSEREGLTSKEARRAKAFHFREFRRPPKVRYHAETVPKGQKAKWYYRQVEGRPLERRKIRASSVASLITHEKKRQAIYRMQSVLQISRKEALKITATVGRQVRREYVKFKKTARYKSLKKSEKEKVTFKRWRRWTLVGIEVLLGGEGSE